MHKPRKSRARLLATIAVAGAVGALASGWTTGPDRTVAASVSKSAPVYPMARGWDGLALAGR